MEVYSNTSFSELHANLEIEIQNLQRARFCIDVGKRGVKKTNSIKSENLENFFQLYICMWQQKIAKE